MTSLFPRLHCARQRRIVAGLALLSSLLYLPSSPGEIGGQSKTMSADEIQAKLESLESQLNTRSLLQIFISGGSMAVALMAMVVAYSYNRRHKEIDITMDFQEAFDSLESSKKDVIDVPQARMWFRRFWDLHTREYEYWVHGYIRDEIFTYWLLCRRADYHNQALLFPNFGYTYRQGWDEIRADPVLQKHPYNFCNFMTKILTLQEADVPHYVRKTKLALFNWHGHIDRSTIAALLKE